MLNDLMQGKSILRLYIYVLMVLGISACASTSVTQSWKQPEHDKSYNHPMIIGVSDSQQTRRIYEKYFVEQLGKKNVTATPSYELISSKQNINRETVHQAVQGTEIDSVLVTYLVSTDTETRYQESPLNPSYSGSPDDNMISATLISNRGLSSSIEVIKLKTDFYAK